MGIGHPYKRLFRPIRISTAKGFQKDPRFAPNFDDYLRAYRLIEKDLLTVFDFVEPTDANKCTYSHRLHQLFVRASIECEANGRAILEANQARHRQSKGEDVPFNMLDYFSLERSCRLSEYRVKTITWKGALDMLTPFGEWHGRTSFKALSWYGEYHAAKHDRSTNFEKANLLNVMNAVASVLILLYAQMGDSVFFGHNQSWTSGDDDEGWVTGPGSIFKLYFPIWSASEKYRFDWPALQKQHDPFHNYPF